MTKDTAYIDHVNGRYEAFTNADGRRYFLAGRYDEPTLIRWLERRHYRVIRIHTDALRKAGNI